MDFTCELCKLYNVTPFEVLKQDKDEVIMLVNYMAERGDEATTKAAPRNDNSKQQIKVNDRTATGGWW